MILADKIIELRKKNGWSQEDLAEKLDVSRQSISKWEGAQSVPDMNRILRLSQVFGVSTDFLLKDDLDTDTLAADRPLPVDADPDVRQVSMEEASAFLAHRERSARSVALGVMLCILSPITLILLTTACEDGRIGLSEGAATGLGLLALFLLVGGAVALFVVTGLRGNRFEYLEKEWIDTAYGVDGMARTRSEAFRRTYTAQLVCGIVLCVLSVIPLFLTMIFYGDGSLPNTDFPYGVAFSLLLLLVAVGTLLIVRACTVWNSFRILLEEGDYTREHKQDNKRNELLDTVYWCAVTAGYLGYSFITMNWHRSWIVWPVAGVVYGLVLAVAKSLRKKN